MEAPPGYANTCFTPSRSRASTRTSQPFRGSSGANLEVKVSGDVVTGAAVAMEAATADEGLGLGSEREAVMR